MMMTMGENKLSFGEVIELAGEKVKIAIAKLAEEGDVGRIGGYFTIYERVNGHHTHKTVRLGNISLKDKDHVIKAYDWEKNSIEKACRMRDLLTAGKKDVISSWQTRDFEKKKYGGAINAGGRIYSFSGFPELVDEILMMVVAFAAGDLTKEEAFKIAMISNNTYLKKWGLIW